MTDDRVMGGTFTGEYGGEIVFNVPAVIKGGERLITEYGPNTWRIVKAADMKKIIRIVVEVDDWPDDIEEQCENLNHLEGLNVPFGEVDSVIVTQDG